MNKNYILGILLIFTLLSCSIVSATPGYQIGEEDDNNGNEETLKLVYHGELVKKYISQDGTYYVNLHNDDENTGCNSLEVTKKKYKTAKIGKDYEWKCTEYPNGKEVISFHRI